MSDDAKHHSNGVCLSCGGTVDENGMADAGDLGEGSLSQLEPDGGPESEAVADDNVRDFARSLQRAH